MQTEVPREVKKAVQKTLWRANKRRVWEFFCSNCKQPRRLSIPRKPMERGAILKLGLTTAFLMLVSWPFLGWKGLVIFVPLASLYELTYRLRVRGMMECPHCGFDPYLYLADVQAARREIETFWKRKFAEKGVPFPPATSPSKKQTPNPDQSALH